jgi:2-dehydro-3-deoxygluconokinase
MLEFRAGEASQWQLGYGGDALNVAIHLARLGVEASFFTAIGDDPFSTQMRESWNREGLDTRLALIDPERRPGLYLIRTDEAGERSFFFWRGESAARRMLSLPGSQLALSQVESADVFFYSLITLAILGPAERERLLAACHRLRARGGQVVFDGNYRAALWTSVAEARAARDAAIAECDIGLPTLGDEALLGPARDAPAVAAHWQSQGVHEVVVKLGAEGCLADGEVIAPPRVVTPIDTSGAGDAFDAAYLAARLGGASIRQAALRAHQLAGWVVGRSGALPARDPAAPY